MEYPQDCPNIPVQINVKWEVLNGSTIVSNGVQQGLASNGGYSVKDVGRSFMSSTPPETKKWSHNAFTPFVANEGKKYRMRLTVVDSGELLNPTKPYIEILACYNPITDYR